MIIGFHGVLVFYHKLITHNDNSCMESAQCLEMNLSDLVMSALDQTDSFSRHSDDTMHSSSFGVMISANDDDDDDDDDDDVPK